MLVNAALGSVLSGHRRNPRWALVGGDLAPEILQPLFRQSQATAPAHSSSTEQTSHAVGRNKLNPNHDRTTRGSQVRLAYGTCCRKMQAYEYPWRMPLLRVASQALSIKGNLERLSKYQARYQEIQALPWRQLLVYLTKVKKQPSLRHGYQRRSRGLTGSWTSRPSTCPATRLWSM